MGSELVMVGEIPFPREITPPKPLPLVGSGIAGNAIGIYLDENIVEHLGNWKGRDGAELFTDDDFFDAFISAPTEKYFRVVIIKEIKGERYGLKVKDAVRDRLLFYDKFGEEEEEELEKILHFFQTPYFNKGSVISYHFPSNSHTAKISYVIEGQGEVKIKVENANVTELIQRWFVDGYNAVSPSIVRGLCDKLGAMLSAD